MEENFNQESSDYLNETQYFADVVQNEPQLLYARLQHSSWKTDSIFMETQFC